MYKLFHWLPLVLCVQATLFVHASALQGQDPRPNVLLIAVDDLNDWIGCLQGHPQAITPNLDRLAKRGVLFRNAHCQGPICGPSRCSLLSGKYPHSTGVYQQPSSSKIEKDKEFFRGHLLPEYFSHHGYKTLASGKITHGYAGKIAFQEYAGKQGGFGPKPEERFQYFLPDVPYTGTQTDWGRFPEDDADMPDFKTASWCISQLEEKHDSPFFLAAGFYRPHVPFYVPAKWFSDFPLDQTKLPRFQLNDLDDVPEIARQIHEMPKYPKLPFLGQKDNEQFRRCTQAYLACVRFVDHQIGTLLDALDKSPYQDNTIILLFSDHGYHLGEKNRVSKHSLWEEATRVPLIVVDGTNRAKVCDSPVGLIDIYPTLLELCGLPTREQNEGFSLVPLLDSPEGNLRKAILTTYARGNHALRGKQYRYIRYENGAEELYDHATDPQEWNNVASETQYAARIADFRKQLPRMEAKYHPATTPGPVNAWFQKHLAENGIE
ncbi:MAG: sulfatase [Planctomycetota bacterium]